MDGLLSVFDSLRVKRVFIDAINLVFSWIYRICIYIYLYIFICKCKYTIRPSLVKGRGRYRCGTRVGCGEPVPLESLRVSSYVFIKHACLEVRRITTKSKQLFWMNFSFPKQVHWAIKTPLFLRCLKALCPSLFVMRFSRARNATVVRLTAVR